MSVNALSRRRAASPAQAAFRPDFRPSDTRIAHHDLALVDVEITKQSRPVEVWRRCAGLYGLLRSKAINEGQVSAAQFWATDYEIGVLGGTDPEMERGAKRGDIHDAMIGRMGSAARRDYIRQRIGARGEQLMVLLMIEGLSITAMAKRLVADVKNTSGAVSFLLEQLTEHYDGMPGPLWKG
ncbi:hypothetical protein SXCC_04777 [Gluconacetobacter sp. SXCC-1]|uniref:hypothetical protein n=1 Tax=Komagataeibacter rhaeticus TaxID=215221 RepID=UPI000207FA0E|nr:hypothetical protein [Komagataeibacter rhaeticus]EGG74673.1 hypothetical protein SXCC_04777 [Gluconacetobacter sp. SXCC-1]WPP22421.1 hypothetical protein SCD25_02685 [Komagataeibacter rhaeticus]